MTKAALKERGVEQFCCDMTYRRFANSYKKEHYDTWVLAREGTKLFFKGTGRPSG